LVLQRDYRCGEVEEQQSAAKDSAEVLQLLLPIAFGSSV
jgi:hypothetical protein